MTPSAVISVEPLGFPWATDDPFLFCAHHDDLYPPANAQMGPDAPLTGRQIGADFAGKDGWRMYHGSTVPGFPAHPHRGFETVTIVRHGLIDHADSLGASARFGPGDVQWLTAGRGIVHAEMFPLLNRDGPNRLELFQIWLNQPARDKMVEPHFAMYWNADIARQRVEDENGRATEIVFIAGALGDVAARPPPPKSWASDPASDLAIWTITMAPQARWTLPAARPGSHRKLYNVRGSGLQVAGRALPADHVAGLAPGADAALQNGAAMTELLLLQGRPIGEPVVQHGPFVMTSAAEIQQAYTDFRRTGFGGWPFADSAPVHPRAQPPFARHADGRVEHGR